MTFDEARSALYLDAGGGLAEQPAIVGALHTDHRFTQWIVAADCRDLEDAPPAVRALRLRDLLPLIGGQCVGGIRACIWNAAAFSLPGESAFGADPAALFAPMHPSAADTALAWAASYPGLTLSTEPPGSRDQLHACFRLAGYRPDRADARAARANRLPQRHPVVGRLAPRHRPTIEAWQVHLDDNRHDCLGLRHLMLRATAEMEKRAAYLDTVYSVRDRGQEIEFGIGARIASLDALVLRLGVLDWAHVSACDPGLAVLTPAENERRSAALTLIARQRGYIVLDGAGQDRDRQRAPEHTRFIAGMPPAEARDLARQFGQWAIVTGTVHGAATLEWCLDGGPDPLIVNQLAALI